jgi:hypothetical protein
MGLVNVLESRVAVAVARRQFGDPDKGGTSAVVSRYQRSGEDTAD